MSFCDKMSSGIMIALIQGLHRYSIIFILNNRTFKLIYFFFHSWVCQDGCTYFYAQVLIYGVGIPFIFVIVSSLLGPKTQGSHIEGKDVKNYGTICRTEETTSLIEYVN